MGATAPAQIADVGEGHPIIADPLCREHGGRLVVLTCRKRNAAGTHRTSAVSGRWTIARRLRRNNHENKAARPKAGL